MRSVIYFMGSVINFILWGRFQIYGVGYLCYELGPKSRGVFFFINKIHIRNKGYLYTLGLLLFTGTNFSGF